LTSGDIYVSSIYTKTKNHDMKKLVFAVLSVCIFFCGYSQNKITGVSTYAPYDDSISVSITELNYLISHSRIVCCKIDTLDDGGMVKTVEIEAKDTSFRLMGAYLESNIFFQDDVKVILEVKPIRLRCSFAVIDNGGLFYESYELNTL